MIHSNIHNRKMVLKEELKNTKMSKEDIVASYLTTITQVCDKLVAVGETMANPELERVALNRFTKPWAPFVKGIVAREIFLA